MNIAKYRFGRIDIDGRSYHSDVIVTPERIIDSWWRKDGHRLAVDDLEEIVAARPDILVVGTGFFGRMVVSEEVRRYLEARGIRVLEARTAQAVEDLNNLQAQSGRVVAALHLTC
jgi:hypothetical protein